MLDQPALQVVHVIGAAAEVVEFIGAVYLYRLFPGNSPLLFGLLKICVDGFNIL